VLGDGHVPMVGAVNQRATLDLPRPPDPDVDADPADSPDVDEATDATGDDPTDG